MLALEAGTDFEVGGSVWINVGRKEQFVRVISDRHAVCEFHDSQTIVKDFERGFLPFSLEDVAHHKHRLTFPLGAEIAQRVLSCGGARKLAAGTGSYRWHREPENGSS